MKRLSMLIFTFVTLCTLGLQKVNAQGWPANYGGVMLQGFYWDSYDDSAWKTLTKNAPDLKGYIDLVWIPQAGNCGGTSMGYDDLYWFPGGTNYTSSFGTENQLRTLIKTYKDNGIGTIADVVINHRKTPNDWFTFPKETYKGVTYQLLPSDICSNDDGGKAKTEADKEGVTLSSNSDSGEDWDGMRDLDHKSTNVQTIVKAYLKMLLNDLGYAGFRYDMVKGYGGEYTGIYNTDAKPTYSVGEYWDGNATTVKNWIDKTKVNSTPTSAAFDFPFRYTVRDAANKGTWSSLGNASLMSDASYRQYAVTFVENHDTEKRANDEQDPLKKDTLAANAFMLAMPGTPCIFYKHWLEYENDFKAMIDARKLAGINNQSTYSNYRSNTAYYANTVTGTKGKLLVVVGNTANVTVASNRYVKILDGYHYAYYVEPSLETAWADKASGTYKGVSSLSVKLTAVSASATQLVYTTDGTTPTASSTKVNSGASITIPEGTTTLKVALLNGSTVGTVITRTYNVTSKTEEELEYVTPPTGYKHHAYFLAPTTWGKTIRTWAWDSKNNYTGGNWPGDSEHTYLIGKSADGRLIYEWCYYGDLTTAPTGIIFNDGTSQTKDLTFVDGGWYDASGTLTNQPALGITAPSTITRQPSTAWYTLSGQRIDKPSQKGIYIHNGRKVIVK